MLAPASIAINAISLICMQPQGHTIFKGTIAISFASAYLVSPSLLCVQPLCQEKQAQLQSRDQSNCPASGATTLHTSLVRKKSVLEPWIEGEMLVVKCS